MNFKSLLKINVLITNELITIDAKLSKDFTGIVCDAHRIIVYFKNGKCHCLSGPAILYKDGSRSWYKEGKLHRLNGPAIEYSNGHKEWWLDGKKHSKESYDMVMRLLPNYYL